MKKVSLVMLVTAVLTLGYAVVTYGGEHCCSDEPVVVGSLEYIADLVDFEGEYACIEAFNVPNPGDPGIRCQNCGNPGCRGQTESVQIFQGYIYSRQGIWVDIFREYRVMNFRCGQVTSDTPLWVFVTRILW